MKKIYLISTALLTLLTACEDYNDQFNVGSQISDVKNGVAIQLAASDYSVVANDNSNKELALSKDPENGTYVKALEAIGKNRYFGSKTEAEWFLPAFINYKYPQADAGSRFSVSYNIYREPSGYLADFQNLSEYTLSVSDYKKVWGEEGTATYLSPSTLKKLPDVLLDQIKNPNEGNMVVVNYAYSEFEPGSGGGAIPVVYQQVDNFDGKAGNYVIAAKGEDGNYYPFGKLKEESYTYGYMYPEPITVKEGIISGSEGVNQVVTLAETDGGYTLQNTWGQYLYMSGTFDSFNVSETSPTEGGIWNISSVGNGLFAIKNIEKDKTVKLTFYKDSYSYGAYAESKYAYFSDPMNTKNDKFTIKDVKLPEGSTYVWKLDEKYGYYKASAFVNGQNLPSESYLVSSEIDLSKATSPVLNFEVAMNHLKAGKLTDYFKVMVSENYAGDVASASWVNLNFDNSNIGNSWDFYMSGNLDLAAFKGKKITIAYVYMSTEEVAPTLEVKNSLIKELDSKYWDVYLFKETAESELAAAMLNIGRVSGAYANSSALYIYTNGKWTAYNKEDVDYMIADPKMYAELGADYISKPSTVLPYYLMQKYPFAVKGDRVAVIYKKGANETPIVEEYLYNSVWSASTNYSSSTTIFEKAGDGTYTAQAGVYLDASMLNGDDGGFKPQDVAMTGVTYVWKLDSKYGWKASAFMGSNNPAESWLVSPAIDLSDALVPQLVFEEAHKFLNGSPLSEYLMVKVSTDYVDNVETCTWETIEVDETQWSDGQSWDFYKVGPYGLDAYVGQVIRIAFVYKSTEIAAPTWEIKNFKVSEAE